MKEKTLPGFTAESSLYSRGGRRYANGIGGSGLKPNSVIAAKPTGCWRALDTCLNSNGAACTALENCIGDEASPGPGE